MWYCFDCEEYFDSPDMIKELHTELAGMGGVVHEEFCTCPKCGGDDVSEATDKCDLCGETVINTRLVGNTAVCENCFAELEDEIETLIKNVTRWFKVDKTTAIDVITGYFE